VARHHQASKSVGDLPEVQIPAAEDVGGEDADVGQAGHGLLLHASVAANDAGQVMGSGVVPAVGDGLADALVDGQKHAPVLAPRRLPTARAVSKSRRLGLHLRRACADSLRRLAAPSSHPLVEWEREPCTQEGRQAAPSVIACRPPARSCPPASALAICSPAARFRHHLPAALLSGSYWFGPPRRGEHGKTYDMLRGRAIGTCVLPLAQMRSVTLSPPFKTLILKAHTLLSLPQQGSASATRFSPLPD